MMSEENHSITIRADEVLMYLNHLGYKNISAKVLKEFLTDLKKLIKACHKQIVFTEYEPVDPFLNDQDSVKIRTRRKNERHKNLEKGVQTSFESRNLQTRDNKHISVHFMRKVNKEPHEHCIHIDEEITEKAKDPGQVELETEQRPKLESQSESTAKSSKTSLKDSSSQVNIATSRKRSKSAKKLVKTKSVNTCDPVALFHYYQNEWKKVKFPGVEHHNDLRRTIRQKLRTDEPISSARSSSARRRECLC